MEQLINQKLNKYPKVKRIIKRIYQRLMCMFSSKMKCEGNVIRISPDDRDHEYFFGYYDKSPWDITGRYVLCLRAKDSWSNVAPPEEAEILLIDTEKEISDTDRVRVIAVTHAWNVQQGCMVQWLGPDFNNIIIYNDYQEGKFCSIVLDVFTGKSRRLKMPVYSVSQDGTFALTLDFARLHRLRPGYGYSNAEETTRKEKIPVSPAIWKLDIVNNTVTPVLSYLDFASFESRPEMENAEHKVNHIMISPSGKRFMVIHRWLNGQRKYSRLVTVNIDGSNMYNLSDDNMVSHCCWKDDETILAYENKRNSGPGYYLMKDRTQNYRRLWPHISADGHPSYNQDKRLVLTDTYPNRKRIASIKILNEDFNIIIAKVFAPFKYDNEVRCDLHPRWSRDGKAVCFDSVFEGHRGIYMVPVNEIRFAYSESTGTKVKKMENQRIKIVYLMTSCKRLGPVQQTLFIIKNLDQDAFEPILITIYDEEEDSRMEEFLPYVSSHYLIKTSKKDIILGHDNELREKLQEIQPDLIHTIGVFPDYAVCRIGRYKQIHTLRNYVYDDYPAKFGKLKGALLAKMQLKAARKSSRTIVCSESLSNIYKEKLGLSFECIKNGVDFDQYSKPNEEEKKAIRADIGLPAGAFVFVYTGQFIARKNISFLLDNYSNHWGGEGNIYLLMLGEGPELDEFKTKYAGNNHILFKGKVPNVNYYLKACDAYISTSKSEGLPNGVLEAMATGLPVILSDIEQHREIFEVDDRIGYLYKQQDNNEFVKCLDKIYEGNGNAGTAQMAGKIAYEVVHKNFSALVMSNQYQDIYLNLINRKNCHNAEHEKRENK